MVKLFERINMDGEELDDDSGNIQIGTHLDLNSNDIGEVDALQIASGGEINSAGSEVDFTDNVELNGNNLEGVYPIYANTQYLDLYGDTHVIAYGGGAGDFDCDGELTAGTKTFKIDHPLDPENMFLSHSCIEGPEMRNMYYGQVEIVNGKATVKLPKWWHPLNGENKAEFNYQLTSIGTQANLYISQEVENGEFEISSDIDCKVSWQLSGIRHDKVAEEKRVQVETYKNKEVIEHFPEKESISDKLNYDSDLHMVYNKRKPEIFMEMKPHLLSLKALNEELKGELTKEEKIQKISQIKELKITLNNIKGGSNGKN